MENIDARQQYYGSLDETQLVEEQRRKSSAEGHRQEHLGKNRQYWRDMILGINDGLISTYLLVVGVVGSGLSSNDVLLTAVAGALAGAVSMAAGEFIATKSQNEVLQGEIGLERIHIRDNQREEIIEAVELLERIGIPREACELQHELLRHYKQNSDALLKLMMALEFGFVEDEERSPFLAANLSGLLFFCASLPCLIAFSPLGMSPHQCLFVASVATLGALLAVGGMKTWATRGSCLEAAMENLIVAGVGGCLAYTVGSSIQCMIYE